MATTGLGDIIKPVAISRQFTALLFDHLVFTASGAATADFDALAQEGGDTITIKRFGEDTVADEVNDGSTSVAGKIASVSDVGVVLHRKRVRGVDDVVKAALGTGDSDAVNAEIAKTQAYYWTKMSEQALVNVFVGLFDDTAGILKDTNRIVGNSPANFNGVVDAMALLGDNMNDLSIMITSSKAWANLTKEVGAKANYIAITGPDGKIEAQPFYDGRRVLLTDQMPKVTIGVIDYYPIILARPASIAFAYQRNLSLAYQMNALVPTEILTSKIDFVAHVRGTKWIGAIPAGGPTNANLQVAASWALTDSTQSKTVGIVEYLSPLPQ
jgi:hypothetical protein